MSWWQQDVPLRIQTKVDPVRLSFDPSNPRFTPEKNPGAIDDKIIVSYMAKSADVGELVDSISASGYIDIEPLIVLGEDEKLIVLEGNRRLAALRIINDESLARAVRIVAPEISQAHFASTKSVSVYRVEHREDARDLIGFKHINGPQPWDALAKARFAAQWFDDEQAKRASGASDALTLADITQRMGDKHDTIFRIVTASYALDQAEEAGLFFVSDKFQKTFSFSHLYTALTYPEIRDFVGMAPVNRTAEPTRNPVPTSHYEQFQQLLLWLYGSAQRAVEPVIRTQAKDLGRLKKVIGNQNALPMLIASGSLDTALAEATPGTVRLGEHLLVAKASLEKAQSVLQHFDGEDQKVVDAANGVYQSATFIHRNVMNVAQTAGEKGSPDNGSDTARVKDGR